MNQGGHGSKATNLPFYRKIVKYVCTCLFVNNQQLQRNCNGGGREVLYLYRSQLLGKTV